MSYKRTDDGRIVLDLSPDQFDGILIALGYALGFAQDSGNVEYVQCWLRLVNQINQGNPNYTPYEVTEQ